ncbi:DUF5076 domain-containing protein [Pseudorhodoferax sp. Leaf265]|uniref:DUF5076 domain-containing protein n=1 Tax=Pseudorhodoferax sp. Leaf265 TaxID=1736315 RepID=UPI0009EBDADF|nr:DUF5076 domain-containing protein [Pseudorhodoferax sp. Leaf265]
MSEIEQLAVPTAALNATEAAELARIWISDGNQVVTLSPRMWNDPSAWGLMLVDLAKHVAAAYESNSGLNPEETLAKIKTAFDAEWSHPT